MPVSLTWGFSGVSFHKAVLCCAVLCCAVTAPASGSPAILCSAFLDCSRSSVRRQVPTGSDSNEGTAGHPQAQQAMVDTRKRCLTVTLERAPRPSALT